MVPTPVSVCQFVGLPAESSCHQLATQTNAEDGNSRSGPEGEEAVIAAYAAADAF